MANCSAGNCSCECGGGKGCGCIASSDFPDDCQCHCYGAVIGGGLTLGLNAFVDVSISGLSLLEAAKFFNSVHSGPSRHVEQVEQTCSLESQAKALKRCLGTFGSGQRRESKEKDEKDEAQDIRTPEIRSRGSCFCAK